MEENIMFPKLYTDESGDLGQKGSNNFNISILKINNQKDDKKLKKIIFKASRGKFSNELKNKKEIKHYNSSKKLRNYLIENLLEINFNSYSMNINKKNKENKKLIISTNKNIIYQNALTDLLSKININKPYELRMDRFIPRNHENDFNKAILNENLDYNKPYKIYHSYSEKFIGIQFADLIAGITFQAIEYDNSDLLKKLGNKHKIFDFKHIKKRNKQ